MNATYNVSFVMDSAVLVTTVEAIDEGDAHSVALSRISDDLGLELIHTRYQIEVEKL